MNFDNIEKEFFVYLRAFNKRSEFKDYYDST